MTMNLLRCPDHPDVGELISSNSGNVCQSCGRLVIIRDGIIDLLPSDSPYEDEFRDREAELWDAQALTYEEGRTKDSVYMACVEAAAEALSPQPGELVLDAGCGTGLTLRNYWQPGVRAVAFDLSMESLRQCRHRGPANSALFVRGDLTQLPFADATFDRVLCPNVLQQVPGAEVRRQCARELARVAKPGARVVFTVHNYSHWKQWRGWQKENSRATGPSGEVHYIYRHEVREFRELVSNDLMTEQLCGAGFPLWYRWKLSPISRLLERLLRRIPALAPYGHMLVAVCRRPA
jgi:SAM-dependent methyltransferase